jgi:hypothetical protein
MSFTPDTRVLLASGTTAAISSLKPGDKVTATNVTTGKTQPEAITAVEVHHDTDLYDLKVKTSHGTQVIHTTASHLFYDPHLKQWQPASKLKKGEHLQTPDGSLAVADGGVTPKLHDGWMWDLTVPGNNDHDFYVVPAQADGSHHTLYVVAGNTPVLVHNCTGGVNASGTPCSCSGAAPYGTSSAYTVAYQMDLPTTSYPGFPRALHFRDANTALYNDMASDPSFAAEMEQTIPGITKFLKPGPRGGFPDNTPATLGWTWHHAITPGEMQLVPLSQHRLGGVLQALIHPGGVGGYKIWG